MGELCIEVGSAVVEDAEVSTLPFFLFVHLLCHTSLNLLRSSLVALDGTLETQVEWGIDFDGDIDSVLEARLEEEGTFLYDEGCILLLFCPQEEVLTDNGVDDAVDTFSVALVGKEVAGNEGFIESAWGVGVSAKKLCEASANEWAFGHKALGFVIAMIDGDAALLEQLADIGLAATDASCNADAYHSLDCSMMYSMVSGLMRRLRMFFGFWRTCTRHRLESALSSL